MKHLVIHKRFHHLDREEIILKKLTFLKVPLMSLPNANRQHVMRAVSPLQTSWAK